MNATALCWVPLQYFAPRIEDSAGQKLTSTSTAHSVLVASTLSLTVQLVAPQRLSTASDTAYGLPYETLDHV